MKLTIYGDGSYLGLIDASKYKSFVGEDWSDNPKLLEPHFIEEMKKMSRTFLGHWT